MKRYKVTVTTNASGVATAYTPRVSGELVQIEYVKTDFENGVDFTITDEATGKNLWVENDVNASAMRSPRAPTHTTAGVASLYAASGVAVNDRIGLANTRVKIAIASGGNVKSGTFHVLVA